jgi:tellurite resistance protein TerC
MMIPSQILPWVAFSIFVIVMLVLDLGVFHRKAHEVKFKESLIWSGVWISLALLFNVIVYFWHGPKTALEFLTGYLIEESLSVDNLFVFLMLFSYFSVPAIYQHRVLFWGIVGALIMRAIFIATGITLIHKFYWLMYILGAFLIITGIRMASQKDKEIHPERNPVLKLLKRFVPVTDHYEDGRFFIRKGTQYWATPLFVVLIVVETTDIIFALDSVPAILAITTDPFIVYTSNVFAILGLRSLYFALAGMMRLFHYLNYGLSVILAFVGMKMLISEIYKIPIGIALGVVAGILIISVLASIAFPRKTPESH